MLEKMRLQCTVTSSLMSDQDHPISITQQNPVRPLLILVGVATMGKNHQMPKHFMGAFHILSYKTFDVISFYIH